MNKNKHLILDDRFTIQHGLSENKSFKTIASEIGKDCTTVSKEIRNHMLFKKKGAPYKKFNDCVNRTHCHHRGDVCPACDRRKDQCSSCTECFPYCPDYTAEVCPKLSKPPYVCNGCPDRSRCTLEKHIYDASAAHSEYIQTRSESRSGFNLTKDELAELDAVISPLILNGQSLHHIMTNNADAVSCCERTAYEYLDNGLFSARNIDMPRKVRFRPRKVKSVGLKVDKTCRTGRTYQDFKSFMAEHPGTPVVELDSVEGIKGGAVLLTIHFVQQKFQLAYRRDHNTAASVAQIFDALYDLLPKDTYLKLFPVLLADNGSEFSDPLSLEFDRDGNRRSYVFYCDPSAPGQKGACENNHEMIRRIIPKGTDITPYSQNDILLMMNHINSYGRPDLLDRSPYSLFRFYYGKNVPEKLGFRYIQPNDIILRPSLLDH